jgi:hypothetical protein
MMTFFITNFSQQPVEQEIRIAIINERLPDGSVILEMDGVRYRALPPEKLREVVIKLETGRVAEERVKTLTEDFNTFKALSEEARVAALELAEVELKKKDERVAFWEGQYLAEEKLRKNYERIVKSCTGKILIARLCFR